MKSAIIIGAMTAMLGFSHANADDKSKDLAAYLITGFQTKSNVSGFTPANNPMFNYRIGIDTSRFSANIFTDYDLKKESTREIDINFNIPLVSTNSIVGGLYVGYFNFPNSSYHDMQEVGVTFSTRNMPLNMSIYVSKLFGEGSGNGFIAKATLDKKLKLSDKTRLALGGRLTFNDHYFTQAAGFSHAELKGAATVKIGQSTELDAFITYQQGLGKRTFGEVFKTHVYGGMSIMRGF